jgi:general secretion pathway protein D
LSTPEILTEDNNEAEIIVGEKVPFITSSRTSGDNDATTNSFEYENIGINLKITPHVNNSNKVTLDIDQEIKNLLEKKLYTEEIPLTSNRQIKTKITIDDNQVVMIGGLIKKTINKNKSSIPFLGKIPLLGKLFQRTTENEVKTNLVVIISPKIIRKIENSAIEVSDEDKRFINKNSYPKLKNIFKSTNDNK